MRFSGVLVAVAVSLLVACGGDDSDAGTASLAGTTWEWQETRSEDDSVVKPGDPSKYTLVLGGGNAARIGADCNRASGTYTLDGSELTFTIGPTTQAYCGADSLSTEYSRQLGAVRMQALEGGNLSLSFGDGGGAMSFEEGS